MPILSAEPPEGDGWIHEIKHDGFRTLLRIDRDDIRAFTRGGHDWSDKYGRVIESCRNLTVLFIGEAPPANGTFFYAGDSQIHGYMREVLFQHLGEPADFLSAFAARGFYLDDLVLQPINHIPAEKREPVFLENVPKLTERMVRYRPRMIVTILKRIADYVEEARFRAGIDVPHYSVPFPGTGQQANFRQAMAR